MENFEKCTVAMLGGQCSQHVTGNTSRLNQPQSAIIWVYITHHVLQSFFPGIWPRLNLWLMGKWVTSVHSELTTIWSSRINDTVKITNEHILCDVQYNDNHQRPTNRNWSPLDQTQTYVQSIIKPIRCTYDILMKCIPIFRVTNYEYDQASLPLPWRIYI